VQTVNVHQTFLSMSDGTGMVETYTRAGFNGNEITLPYTPLVGYTVKVYVNGLLQGEGIHYTITGAVVTFINTLSGDDVQVNYASSASSITEAAQVFRYVAILTGTEILLPRVPGTAFPIAVYINGVLQSLGADYTVDVNKITFADDWTGVTVQVLYSA
jgi:hypothetical protein